MKYCGFHIENIYGHVGSLFPPSVPYIDCTTPIKLWAVRECPWEYFDAHPVFVHPPVDEMSDRELDLFGPKLAIHE